MPNTHRNEIPLQSIHTLQIFENWVIDFIGLITLPMLHNQARYIIMETEYLTGWDEATSLKDYTADTSTRFIFENIISRFGCLRSLTSDQGTHFINETIASLLHNFLIYHHKSIQYHPRANGTVEAFNKILEKGLTKVCLANRDNCDDRVLAMLWAYCTIVKRLQKKTPFQLVYEREFVVPT